MKLITEYILSKYIKYFLIVLISLDLFFVGIDFLQNYSKIPSSANLQLLYLFYNAFFAVTLVLPLALVFGWIVTLIMFIRSNEFVIFLSLGAKPSTIYLPIVLFSLAMLFVLILLQGTTLAYSYEQRKNIMDGRYFSSFKNDIFLKDENSFVYFKKFLPLKQEANDIRIYKVNENDDMVEIIVAQKAIFKDNTWNIMNAKIISKPEKIDWATSKLSIKEEKNFYTLEGFNPSILDNIYKTKSNLSILDAIQAIFLLNKQDIDTKIIRLSLYYQIFVPFFILPLIVIIFVLSSANSRFFNIAQFSSLMVFSTLVCWGGFFVFHKLSQGGVILPEIALLLPLGIWFIVGYAIFKSKIKNF